MMRTILAASSAIVLLACTPAAARAPQGPAEAAVKSEIADLFADYGFAADQRDPETVSSFFAEDGALVIPLAGIDARGRAAIVASFEKTWAPVAAAGQQRRHVITGLRLTGGARDARSFRAIMTVAGTAADGKPQVYVNGYYVGEAVRTAAGWKFRRLEIRVDTGR